MNSYGKFAQNAWKTLSPIQYELIVDPEAWFTSLGKEAENSVDDLSVQIAGHDTPGETYLQKVGRLNNAKMSAEEIVRAEMLTPQPGELLEEEPEDEEPSSMSVALEYMKEVNRQHRDDLEDLQQEELEREMKLL